MMIISNNKEHVQFETMRFIQLRQAKNRTNTRNSNLNYKSTSNIKPREREETDGDLPKPLVDVSILAANKISISPVGKCNRNLPTIFRSIFYKEEK